MNTRRSFGNISNYLIVIGLSNLIFMIGVSVIRYFYNLNVIANAYLFNFLSLEPYVKVAVDIVLFIVFMIFSFFKAGKRDRMLMLVWGFVVIPIQIIYFISSNYYTTLISTMTDFAGTAPYVAFYTSTHVLKYSMIFYVTIFAILVTGLSLGDYCLPIISIILCIMYTASFSIVEMPAITIPGMTTIGIVIPAFLYHITESVVMIFSGIYLNIRFSIRRKKKANTIDNAIAEVNRKPFLKNIFKR